MSPALQTVRLRAYAKINWALELLGKRSDGYHEIRTVTQTVSLWDELEVRASPHGTPPVLALCVSGTFWAPADKTNLCWRAAEAFMATFGQPAAVDIRLTKHVPAGTGRGGGSSDCVATLAALSRLTGLGTADDLRHLAAALGSDTVLFLTGAAALCSGRGEIVTPLAGTRTHHLVIARPDVHVPTREAYSGLTPSDFSDGSQVARLARALQGGAAAADLGALLVNSFRPRVAELHPQIAALIQDMLGLGALASEMTGSGSGVFGLVGGEEEARRLAQALSDRGYWVVAAHTLERGYEFLEVLGFD